MSRNTASGLVVLLGSILAAGLFVIWLVFDGGPVAPDVPPGPVQTEQVAGEQAAGGSTEGEANRRPTPDQDSSRRGPDFLRALSGFRGRVTRRTGQGIGGVAVAILRFDEAALLGEVVGLWNEGPRRPDLVAGRSHTGEDGRFVLTGVWPGSFYVLRAGGDSGRVLTRIVTETPGPGEIVDLGDIILGASTVITGRIVDAAGRPVVGATIRAAPIPEHLLKAWPLERFDPETPLLYADGDNSHVLEIPGWIRERLGEFAILTTRSDESGSFRLTGAQPGHLAVFASAPNRVPAIRPATRLQPGGTTDLGTIVVGTGATVRGQVLDESGRPLPGAEVLVGQGTALISLVFAAHVGRTGDDGRFTAAGFRPGRIVAAARAGPHRPWVISDRLPIAAEVVLRIPAARTLTVAVRSRTGGRLHGVRFKLLTATPDTAGVDLSLYGFRPPLELGDRWSRLAEGRYRLADLQQGRYVLMVGATAHATRSIPFTLETDTDLTIDLAPQGSFVVVAIDGDGQPVADADVYVQARQARAAGPRLPVRCGRTDEDGRLRVTQASADRSTVRVVHPAHGSTERAVDLPAEFVHVQFGGVGAIAGTLTEAGRTPAPGKWNLAIRSTGRPTRGPIDLPRLAAPRRDGSFHIAGVPAGDYEVSIIAAAHSAPLGLALDMRAFADRLRAPDQRRIVPVLEGRTTRLDIDTDPSHRADSGPSATVSGTVTVNGQPAEGLEVRGWHRRWLSGLVGDDGRFSLGEVPVGAVGLYVVDPRIKNAGRFEMLWWRRIEVAAGSPVELTIDLRLGGISGRVLHADAHGVPGCQVKLTGKSAATGRSQTFTRFYGITDRRGAFAFDNLPEGTYTASVWDRRNGRGQVADIPVSGGTDAGPVHIRLLRVVQLTGRVDMHLLEPGTPQWCWLRLYGKDDRGGYVSKERGAKVRSDGSFAVDGVPPGRYEVSIGAMYRRTDTATGWDTRMFVHDTELDVGPTGLRGVLLRPRPRPPKPPEQAPLPAAAPRPDAEQEPEAKPQTEAKQEPEAKPKRQAQRQH